MTIVSAPSTAAVIAVGVSKTRAVASIASALMALSTTLMTAQAAETGVLRGLTTLHVVQVTRIASEALLMRLRRR